MADNTDIRRNTQFLTYALLIPRHSRSQSSIATVAHPSSFI
ncbi:hypothetical protein [uncultured Nostoc sp.]